VKLRIEVFAGDESDMVRLREALPPTQFVVQTLLFDPLQEASDTAATTTKNIRRVFQFIQAPQRNLDAGPGK